jgi:CAAX protease family protein
MPYEPQSIPQPITGPDSEPLQPSASGKNLIAPLWHTLLILLLILGNSFLGSSKLDAVSGHASRLLLYGGTFVTELVLVLIIWFGIRSRGVRMRDLIGGRWETVEAFLLDVGLAIGFLVASLTVLFGVRVALGLIDLHNLEKSTNETVRMLSGLAPHTYLEAGAFVLLAVSAGLFEEIIFRGYLQRQFNAIFNHAVAGIVGSGVIFGLAHGYQGARGMVVIAVFGILFGTMAHLRKSLRPGMIAHALQDSVAGIALFRFVR